MASPSKRSKVTTRSTSKKAFIHSLPTVILHKIYAFLDIQSLQEISVTNKYSRQTVLNILDRPLIFPLKPRHSPGIEVEVTKTLVFKSALFDSKWLNSVFSHFNKVTVLEVATSEISSRYKIKELIRATSGHSISKVLVHISCYKKWASIRNSMPKTVKVKVQTLPDDYFTKRRLLLAGDHNTEEEEAEKDTLLFSLVSAITPITSHYQSWMSPVEGMVGKFNQFQKESIQLYQTKGKLYNPQQVLSLSHIYLFSPEAYRFYNIDMTQWHTMLYHCRNKYDVPEATVSPSETDRINRIIHEFAVTAYRDFGGLQRFIESIRSQDINQHVFKMLENVSYKCKYNHSHSKIDEDTHTMEFVDPVVNAFLDSTIHNLSYRGCGYELPESKLRKTQQVCTQGYSNDKIQGRKPDRSAHVFTLENNGVYNLYLCEIKTESESKGHPDLAKLGVMMKNCLDHALMNGASMEKYNVIGLLIEGKMCTVYILDLTGHGLYRMIEMDVFFLSTSIKELNFLSFAYQPLLNIRARLIKNLKLWMDAVPSIPMNEKHAVESHMRRTCKSPAHYTDYYA